MRMRLGGVFVCASVTCAPLMTWADVVELATGERIHGGEARVGGDVVTLTVGSQTLIFQRAQVRAIYMGPAPPPCGSAMPSR